MVNLNIKQKMELILTVGQILAENGAVIDKIITDTKRVAAIMKIPAENFNLKIMPDVLLLNVFDGEKSNIAFRNYDSHGVDINIVHLIDDFTLKAASKNYSSQKFQEILDRIIAQKKNYSHTRIIAVTGLFCGAFCILFGGDLSAAVYTAISAAAGKFSQLKLLKFGVNHFLAATIAAFIATSTAYAAHFLPTVTMWHPMIACSLFLIPGIPIINAVTESFGGYFLNGMTKAYQSLLITVSMTVGIIIAVTLCEHIEEIDVTGLSLSPNPNFIEVLFAAMTAAISFSHFINAPKKILMLAGILGVTSLTTRHFIMFGLGLSQEIATFIAALFIGILAINLKKFIRVPTQVLTVPAIIAFVPGVLIYRFLISCIYIKYFSVEEFFYELGFGIDALQIIFAMTIGVTLPDLAARRFLKNKR